MRDGRPIREGFFPDLFFALTVMAEIGAMGDPRCAEALRVLKEAGRRTG